MNKTFNLIVAGGRDFNSYTTAFREISKLVSNELSGFSVHIVSGTARGADSLGSLVAQEMGLPVLEFPAQWNLYGKSAGYRRNVEMAEASQGLLAFWDGQSRGTNHMINIARERGLSVRVIGYGGYTHETAA